MKSFLLVLTLIRNAETRSKVRALLEESGHRVIEVSWYVQAELFLTNGLQPDLVLIDVSRADSHDSAKFYDRLQHFPGVIAHRIVESVHTESSVNSYNSVNERLSPPKVTVIQLESLIDTLGLSQLQVTPIEDQSRLFSGNTALPWVARQNSRSLRFGDCEA